MGEIILHTLSLLCGSGLALGHSRVFQEIYRQLVTPRQALLSQCGKEWLHLPVNTWTLRRKVEVPPRAANGWESYFAQNFLLTSSGGICRSCEWEEVGVLLTGYVSVTKNKTVCFTWPTHSGWSEIHLLNFGPLSDQKVLHQWIRCRTWRGSPRCIAFSAWAFVYRNVCRK